MPFSVISPDSLTPILAPAVEATDMLMLWNPNGLAANKMQTLTLSQLVAYLATVQQVLTDAASTAWSLTSSKSGKLTLTAGIGATRALVITGDIAGTIGTLLVRQDAVGGRALTHNAIPLPLATGANAYTLLRYYFDGTNRFWESVTTLTVT